MKKRVWAVVLALVMTVLLAGCGTYTEPTQKPSAGNSGSNGGGHYSDGNGNNGNGDDPGNHPSKPGEGDEEELEVLTFTVTLTLNGATYTNTEGLKAIWSNRYGMYDAEFVDGVATIKGLDGEYHVTLSGLPDDGTDYTYDRSGIYANNIKRDVEVELLKILTPTPNFNGWYGMSELGTYRATVNGRSSAKPSTITGSSTGGLIVYYFMPMEPGWYTITSWVDTTENKVNPKLHRFNGQVGGGFAYYDTTIDGGGASGTYTKNFKLEYKIFDEEVGNAQIFAIAADSTKGYPVNVEFTIKYEGEYYNPYQGEPVYANGPYRMVPNSDPIISGKTWRYVYWDNRTGTANTGAPVYLLDESRVKLNREDGFYYLYDEELYAENNGYGPLLFAKLTRDCEVFWTMDMGVRIDGGFNWNGANGGLVSCVIDGKDYSYMISTLTDELGNRTIGYASYCNTTYGVHPVNEEIQEFLMGYAHRERFFDDGNGWAELPLQPGDEPSKDNVVLNSGEESKWLFACGYFA